MRNSLYFKLARSNLKKNRQIYFPYTLANILIVSMYYILKSIRSMMLKYETTQGSNSDMILNFCTIVAVIMACIILFYVNSFVIRQRKKEIGLYCVLGMEKRHLSMMMFWEVLITALRGLAGGMIAGALLSQLVFLIFLSMLRIPSDLRFEIPIDAVGSTCLTFGILYLIVLIYNILAVVRTNPIEFLQGAKEGEKEPKVRKLPAILGVALLAAGYASAIGAQGVYETLKIFLPAISADARLFHFFLKPQTDKYADEYIRLRFDDSCNVRTLLEMMVIEYASPGEDTQAILQPLALALLMQVARRCRASRAEPEGEAPAGKIIRFMGEHAGALKLRDVAARFSYHPNYVSGLLRRVTGKTFSEISLEQRMRRAEILLKCTKLPVEDIALMLGYSSSSNFYKAFREYFGKSPREYLKA